jgi:hypothetical protein
LPWTFEKRVAGGSYCRTHLDRALATLSWSARYPLAELHHLSAASLDHSPILLLFDGEQEQQQRRDHIFRYEVMWDSHEGFDPFLKQVWREGGKGTTTRRVRDKLTSLSQNLTSWNKRSFGNVRRQLKQLRERLERLRAAPDRVGPSYEEIKVCDRIIELQHSEEIMWKQRSRI